MYRFGTMPCNRFSTRIRPGNADLLAPYFSAFSTAAAAAAVPLQGSTPSLLKAAGDVNLPTCGDLPYASNSACKRSGRGEWRETVSSSPFHPPRRFPAISTYIPSTPGGRENLSCIMHLTCVRGRPVRLLLAYKCCNYCSL